ncbi:MAG: cytochrome c biogenesis protein CcsA [Saprospiraceae bacterium]|uniref:Cytochrome c biogenesis protein CcsA n=1 Tax=Candidatus Opimibacter skivensis TaxID=2982028 RepID=A0A9D7XP16_9BACT|nr:cytochrome c biogenesis protein CcsA [Candidatus Opimibacter skivensis]
MQDIQYIGEHLLPGRLGHFFVLSGLVSALLTFFAYRKTTITNQDSSWLKFSRISWGVHAFSILSVIGLIFYMMVHQYYEYRYVWDHVSNDLPMKYIFSAFWEGQEGSFLLWMFWHVVLGSVVLFTAKKWESGVMTWLAAIQVVLVSMIAGVYFADSFRMGSSPFMMMRNSMDAPIFQNPNYLSMITGNGLNPLLQNYWMTIHPPTLFLGFASVSIPFCFAMTGLWQKNHTEWLKPVMPWTLFSCGILGTGILMGGAWAYEALSFGGYWAWDPVENMSLVPWVVMLAALHGNFISRHTGHSLRTTYLFYIGSFMLAVYSTFLTRSGILGEESVHAFTQMGLEWQLVGFIGIFLLAAGYFFFSRYKSVPVIKKEESMQSREFWMFVGSLILIFSSILISFTTSIPVWNKLIDVYGSVMGKGDMTSYHKAIPLDPITHYNRFQLWIAVLVTLLAGPTLMLRFGGMGWDLYKNKFFKHIVISAAIGSVVAFLLSKWIILPGWQYAVLLSAASFGVISNVDYLISFGKRTLGAMASGLSHGGFALMVIGIMASGLNKRIVSENKFAEEGIAQGFDPGKNAFLIKNMPMFMNGYWVTYKSDTLQGLTRFYEVEFLKMTEKGDTVEHFTTYPDVLYDRKLTKVATANPDTKRYADRDMFTYVAGLPPEQQDVANIAKADSLLEYKSYVISPGDSIIAGKFIVTLDSISLDSKNQGYIRQENDLALSGNFSVRNIEAPGTKKAYPTLLVRKGLLYGMNDQINDFNLRLRLRSSSLDSLIPLDENLNYEPLVIKPQETKSWKDLKITFEGIDKNITHPNYKAEEGDIAIHGVVKIETPRHQVFTARPLYFIRDGSPFNMKVYLPDLGLHVRLEKIDPAKEEFTLLFARPSAKPSLALEMAEEVPRNDYIVLEAILFPGINLFWGGAIIMLLGMFIGLYKRLRKS